MNQLYAKFKALGCPEPDDYPRFAAWHQGYRAGLAQMQRLADNVWEEAKHDRANQG